MSARFFYAWKMLVEAQAQDERNHLRRTRSDFRRRFDPFEDLGDTEFRNRYRLSKDAVHDLCRDLKDLTELRGTTQVCLEEKMVRYCTYREQNPHLWRGVDWYGMRRLGDLFSGVLYDRPDVGRIIMCKLGKWDPDTTPVEDLIRASLLLLEVGIMQPKLQVLGGTALVDCEGLTMKHMRYLTPGLALQAMNILGYAFPLHQRGVHVINCSRVFETLFHFFKRLAPAAELWRKVYFHGYDMSSLHRHIDPECLPTRYGGKRQETSLYTWLTKIKQYKNKSFDDDISKLGYSCDY